MAWYKAGTVSVTNGSKVVTGSGTAWAANVQAGDAFHAPDGKTYEIDFVSADASLNLVDAYAGTTASGQSYKVQPTQGRVRDLAAAVSTLITEYGSIEAALTVLSGNVGIGTATPGAKLDVSGTLNVALPTAGAFASVRGAASASANLVLQPNGTSGPAYWLTAKNATATLEIGGNGGAEPSQGAVSISGSGNVGIGTNAPSAKFDVAGTTSGQPGRTHISDDGNYLPHLSQFKYSGTASTYYGNRIQTGAGGELIFLNAVTANIGSHSFTERVRIDTSGNLISILQTAAPTLSTNGQMVMQRLSDTQVKILMRGADGNTRSTTLTLA
ncbi:MAG: hypothetical protein ACKOWC_04980 [Limnohabitans sp.]